MKLFIFVLIVDLELGNANGVIDDPNDTATIPGLFDSFPDWSNSRPNQDSIEVTQTGVEYGQIPTTRPKMPEMFSCYQCMGQTGTSIRHAEVCFRDDIQGIVLNALQLS